MTAAETTAAAGRSAAHAHEPPPSARVQAPGQETPPLDDKPRSVYEMITRQMLEDLKSDVAEVKGRVNALIWLVIGAVVADFVMRLIR